jgi:integrase
MNFTVKAVLFKNRVSLDGNYKIAIRVTINRKTTYELTGLKSNEKEFKDGKFVNNKLGNRAISQLIAEKEKQLTELMSSGQKLSIELLNKKDVYFKDHCKVMIDELRLRCKNSYTNRLEYLYRDFNEWAGYIPIKSVDADILKSYEKYLFEKGITPNTIGRNLKKVKQVLNHYGTPIKFKTITYKQPQREYLTIDEIKRIESTDYNHIVKWYFLLSCYTGIRYGDCNDIQNKVVDNNGKRLILSTSKTGEIISVKLSNTVLSIIDKLGEKIPTNEQCNRVLKELAVFAKIDKNLTFHMARHSFAVNSASLGFPVEVVSKLLGHSSIRTTAIYYKLTDSKVDEFMDRWE